MSPAGPAGPARSSRPVGLRREVAILPPAALLLLVVLSAFILFSYRNALSLLAGERRDEAVRLAQGVAEALTGTTGEAASGVPSPADLRRLAPGALAAAVLGPGGETLTAVGDLPPGGLMPPDGAAGRWPRGAVAWGPGDDLPDRVVGLAPLAAGRVVRVDLAAGALAGQLRGARVLTLVVAVVDGGLLLLVFLFLRHLLGFFSILLERARQVGARGAPATVSGGGKGDEVDEVEFLLATFERALHTLSEREQGVRDNAEDDLAAIERTLAPGLQSGLLLLDPQGAVLALNAVGAELLGTPAPVVRTIAGMPLAAVLGGQPELLAVLEEVVAERRGLQRYECRVRSARGELTLGLTAHPLRRGDGQVRGTLVLFADLTEVRRRAEESRLAESLAQLGEMAGGVAHELRNSLATLSGYLTLIERRPGEETVNDFLAEIRRETEHLERVVDDFLAFARPGTARVERFSLRRLLARAAADPSLGPALGGVAVAVHAGDEAGGERGEALLRGDPQLLERALRNLLHNAVEAERAAGGSGPVEVSLAVDPTALQVVVEDRGAGIPTDLRDRLFQPFATGRPGGVGLGLALAHRIVVLHGGTLHLEDRPGGGTRAVISLPRDTFVTGSNDSTSEGTRAPGRAVHRI